METMITSTPGILLETIELVYGCYNQIPAEELTGSGPYCIPPQEVQRMMDAAWGELPTQSPLLGFFFQKEALAHDSGGFTCLARNMAYIAYNCCAQELYGKTLQDSISLMKTVWHTMMRNREYPVSVGRYTFDCGWPEESEKEITSLEEGIAQLRISSAYQQKLEQALGDFDRSAQQLEALLAPVAPHLDRMLAPWAKRAEPLRQTWEAYFSQPDLPALLRERWLFSTCDQVDLGCVALRYLDAKVKMAGLHSQNGKNVIHIHIGVSHTVEEAQTKVFAPWEVQALRLLGSPTRLQMLQALQNKPMSMRELVQELDMHMGTVGRDISSLLSAGLLKIDVASDRRRYQTDPYTLRSLIRHLETLIPTE